jgi:regulator of protease activity HflC (stomatin/prohibitin superfamily)
MQNSGYTAGSQSVTGTGSTGESGLHARLKRQYLDYLGGKDDEIKEQKESRAYYHGAQWTDAQVRTFNKRKQPVVTYNRVGRKINAIVGLLERQKQDPRGFPRTPRHEEGAELATAVLRYVCDQQKWAAISPLCGMQGAVDGLAGVEIIIEAGDHGDPEIGLNDVDAASFFYDPRSLKEDFSDARYMGVGKWMDLDAAIEMFPDKEEELRDSVDSGYDLTSDPASDNKWVSYEAGSRRLRIVDHWYIKAGQWRWCLYTGAVLLDEGESYLTDEMGKSFCRYVMYSANVDQDGDRYGFVRGMKSAQDEINMRRSKGLHLLNSRRMIVMDGEGLDVEKIRTEAAKPDGVIVHPHGSEKPEFDDAAKNAELQGQVAFLEDAKQEIENYGFNPALMGTGVQDMSGRAIQLQQQAGIAELGPYLLAYKGWKLRVYRAIWNAVRQHWTSERWIRVTDDENVAQFVGINQPAVDDYGQPIIGPDGQPQLQNAIGELDVDVILDEGPDTINAQQDTNETLKQILPAIAPMLSPPLAQAALKLLVDTSSLPAAAKKRFSDVEEQAKQPNPQAQMAEQMQMRGAMAEVAETEASAKLKQAQAMKAAAEAQSAGASEDPRAAMMEAATRYTEGQMKLAATAAKARADEVNAGLKNNGLVLANQGKQLDLVGKRLDIQRQREAPAPQQGAA